MVSSLYIHIPFCASKCTYCDFFSVPTKRESTIFSDYIDALKTEIKFYIKKYSVQSLKTIYIGGGTPSFLPSNLIVELLSTIKDFIQIDANAEITIEANPCDITKNLLEAYASAGINRLSVGVQCYSDKVLSTLKRRSSTSEIKNALQLIKENWLSDKKSFSVDMISGLPYLSNKEFIDGLEFVLSFNPSHVSLYSLMVEEGTALSAQIEKKLVEYSEEANDCQWLFGRDFLIQKGYNQYEVSNFALPGFESKHNSVYWKLENYIGCGAGATGTVDNFRWNNLPKIADYIAFWHELAFSTIEQFDQFVPDCSQIEHLSAEDKKLEYLMLGFRLSKGVNSTDYEQTFGENLLTKLGANDPNGVFYKWKQKGLARMQKIQNGYQLSLTKEGLQFLNQFLSEIV